MSLFSIGLNERTNVSSVDDAPVGSEAGSRCDVRVFPEDSHGLTNPRTEFESFVTIAGFLRENLA